MKNVKKSVDAFRKQNEAKDAVIKNLKKKIVENSLSAEAMAEAEAVIAEKEAEIASFKELIAELEAMEDDASAELLAKIAEMRTKIEELENGMKGPKGLLQVQNFVTSKKGMDAFMEVVQNSVNGEQFRENWKNKLVQNGITPADVLLPPAILDEINDTWEDVASNFLSYLDITGLVALKVLTDTNMTDTSRAHGHIKGNQKAEQVLIFEPKEIRAQLVYKYITVDRETVAYEDNTGALMRFIARELAYRVIHEIMRAVLVGDGRLTTDTGHISKIEAITAASALYQTTITAAGPVPTVEEIAAAVDSITADGGITLVMSKATARSLRTYITAAGGTVMYRSLDELAEELGVDRIITTRILENPAEGDPVAIAFVGKNYKLVGDLTMRGFENFILSYNKYEYLTEVYVGGALAVPYSAGVVLAGPATPEP